MLSKLSYPEAIDELETAVGLSGNRAGISASLGYVYALTGERAKAPDGPWMIYVQTDQAENDIMSGRELPLDASKIAGSKSIRLPMLNQCTKAAPALLG